VRCGPWLTSFRPRVATVDRINAITCAATLPEKRGKKQGGEGPGLTIGPIRRSLSPARPRKFLSRIVPVALPAVWPDSAGSENAN